MAHEYDDRDMDIDRSETYRDSEFYDSDTFGERITEPDADNLASDDSLEYDPVEDAGHSTEPLADDDMITGQAAQPTRGNQGFGESLDPADAYARDQMSDDQMGTSHEHTSSEEHDSSDNNESFIQKAKNKLGELTDSDQNSER